MLLVGLLSEQDFMVSGYGFSEAHQFWWPG